MAPPYTPPVPILEREISTPTDKEDENELDSEAFNNGDSSPSDPIDPLLLSSLSPFTLLRGADRLTPDIISTIADKFRKGAHTKVAAASVGLKPSTLRTWLLRGQEHLGRGLTEANSPFANLFTRCRLATLAHEEEVASKWVQSAIEPVTKRTYKHQLVRDNDGNPVIGPDGQALTIKVLDKETVEGYNWQAMAEYLSRRYPTRWGKGNKVELTGAKGGPIETKTDSQLRIEQASYPISNLPEEVRRELLKQLLGEGDGDEEKE